MDALTFIPLSEQALLLSVGSVVEEAVGDQLMALKQAIENHPFDGFIETVPAYHSIAVFYNPIRVKKTCSTIAESVVEQLRKITAGLEKTGREQGRKAFTIPVCYDEEFGIDLSALSRQLQLSVDEIIQRHTAKTYSVFMLGFTPGFPYMGKLDEKLFSARQATPRLNVAAGSVAIAGHQTGIYPLATPGGWNIVGRTPLKIFDAKKENPFLLQAGNEVEFLSITKDEYLNLVNNLSAD